MILLCKVVFYTLTFVVVVDGNPSKSKAEAIDEDRLGMILMTRSRYLYIESIFDFLMMFITGIVLLYKTTLQDEVVPYPLNDECI